MDAIELAARRLAEADGVDPDAAVQHAYGDDFTAWDWERRRPPSTEALVAVHESPAWRMYRAGAWNELRRLERRITGDPDVVPFRRKS